MMARGYTPEEAADRALQMQVRRLVEKIVGGDTARPSESAEPARTAPGAKAPPLTNATKRPPLAQLDPNDEHSSSETGYERQAGEAGSAQGG